jgi:hypothetical protein
MVTRDAKTITTGGVDPIAAARLVVAVGAHRALRGFGPSWIYAARAAGWRWQGPRELGDRMYVLKCAGLVTFTREPHSLDVTPAGRRWALKTLRRQRQQGRAA